MPPPFVKDVPMRRLAAIWIGVTLAGGGLVATAGCDTDDTRDPGAPPSAPAPPPPAPQTPPKAVNAGLTVTGSIHVVQ